MDAHDRLLQNLRAMSGERLSAWCNGTSLFCAIAACSTSAMSDVKQLDLLQFAVEIQHACARESVTNSYTQVYVKQNANPTVLVIKSSTSVSSEVLANATGFC